MKGAGKKNTTFMKRNLILIHLESLNILNYRMNKEFFNTLKKIEDKSVTFPLFYASATSTLMVMSDLAYKEIYINETFRTMQWKRRNEVNDLSVLDSFYNNGYEVSVFDYPPNGVDVKSMNDNNFIGKNIQLKEFNDLQFYHQNIIQIMNEKKPFLLWLCNFMSHIEFNTCIDSSELGINRWSEGYKNLDKEIEYIWGLLEQNNLLKNTTVIFYGDHGDDLYSHGYHGGLTHAIEPYEQLIHTPMFVYDERFPPREVSKIISTVDIGFMIEELLNMREEKYEIEDFPVFERKYAFSRNMFAAQRVREISFGKGYSVSDGRFLLLVTSKGLSMYETVMDPTCQNNILELYELKYGKLIQIENTLKFHFRHLIDEKSHGYIVSVFYELKKALYKFVNEIYTKGNCIERLYEMDFENVFVSNKKKDAIQFFGTKNLEVDFELFLKYYKNKKIVIYGAGNYGKYCYKTIKKYSKIIAWVDQKYTEYKRIYNFDILSPDVIKKLDFDIILIAITDELVMQYVYEMLIDWGVSPNKII